MARGGISAVSLILQTDLDNDRGMFIHYANSTDVTHACQDVQTHRDFERVMDEIPALSLILQTRRDTDRGIFIVVSLMSPLPVRR